MWSELGDFWGHCGGGEESSNVFFFFSAADSVACKRVLPEHGETKRANIYSAYSTDGVFQMDFFAGAANLLKINAGVQS